MSTNTLGLHLRQEDVSIHERSRHKEAHAGLLESKRI